MQARADLLHVAQALAAEARSTIDDEHGNGRGARRATQLAHGAREALEAAALVDADPAPLVKALERFGERLDALYVNDWLRPDDPTEALDDVASFVEDWQREVQVGVAVQHGYLALRELLEGLLRDFDAADTDTARRIATRIHTGLDSASEAIEAAKREQEG